MTWRPVYIFRNEMSEFARITGRYVLRSVLAMVLLVQSQGAFANGPVTPTDPPMPDPCRTAPTLPFCP